MRSLQNIKSIAVMATTVSLLCLTSCANPSYKVSHVYGEKGREGHTTSSPSGGDGEGQGRQSQSLGRGASSSRSEGQNSSYNQKYNQGYNQEDHRGQDHLSSGGGASSVGSGVSILASGGQASSSSSETPHESFVAVPSSGDSAGASKGSSSTTAKAETPQILSPQKTATVSVRSSSAEKSHHIPGVYMVKPGDTLYSISKRFDVPIRDMIEKNHLQPPYQIKLGQTLSLPIAKTHKVVAHDTVYSISRHYGVSVSELIDVNHIKPPYQIKVGEELTIPGKVDYNAKSSVAPVTSEPKIESALSSRSHSKSSHGRVEKSSSKESHASKEKHHKSEPHKTNNSSIKHSSIKHHEEKAPRPIVERLPARSSSHFLWPVHGRIISRFGQKTQGVRNNGISIAAPKGTPIRAAANGIVVYSGDKIKGFGNLILIKHSGGYITAYSHARKSIVHRGEVVRRGQVIGTVGQTGSVEHPQLNFQIRRGRRILNPTHYLK